ncbi:MAG: ABC transporter ATP-binding protein [Albidovulum sp.]|nr:ABC transporter ATP-binding protein [Albidovulum sp.]
MAELHIKQIGKSFGGVEVLRDISLHVKDGCFTSLLGPSGCGKSTLMRIVAGLESPSTGRVIIGGRDVTVLAPERRNISLMFQSYALLPHLSVSENIRFPLRMRRTGSRAEQDDLIAKALTLVQLEGLQDRMPRALSGGQQQRVALARAIVAQPEVLLLDEPLSNLDARLRTEMQVELIELHRRLRLTTVFVTHDQDEALTLSDRVAVMTNGRIEQEAPPSDLYDRPRTRFVADFLGAANVLELAREPGTLAIVEGQIRLPDPPRARFIALRQEDLELTRNPEHFDHSLPVQIVARVFLGGRTRYKLDVEGLTLFAIVPRGAYADAESGTHVAWNRGAIHPLSE